MSKEEAEARERNFKSFLEVVEADPRTAMVRETGSVPAEDFLVFYGNKEGGVIEYKGMDERIKFYSLNGRPPTRRKIQQLIREGIMRRGRDNRYHRIKGTPTPI